MSSKFGFETNALEVVEGVDLSGKEIIITGGSSGIGIETTRALAKAGARITIGARNLEKAEAVAKEIRESTKNPNIEVEELELGSLTSVNEFVKRYLEKKRPLNILINNAGVLAASKSLTVDGFETDFGTNHVGHFALTLGLIPALIDGYKQSGKKSRVISVSSMAHVISDIIYDDVNFTNREWDLFSAYGQSKTANMLFSVGLTHHYSDKGIISNSVMPGAIKTDLARDVKPEQYTSNNSDFVNVKMKYKNAEQGASTSVWAAVAPELENVGGKYLEDCQFSKLATKAEIYENFFGYQEHGVDLNNALKFWDFSLDLIKNHSK